MPHLKVESINTTKGNRFLVAGFTLLEVLIVVGIISGVFFIVSIFAFDIFNLQLFIGESLGGEAQSQYAFKIIIPELRSIGPSSSGGYPISSASSSSFSFYSDIDNDGLFEQVRYFLNGTTFQKGVIRPTGVPLAYDPATEKIINLASNVISGNIFSYFNKNYDGINGTVLGYPIDVSTIRVVKVVLSIDKNQNIEPGPLTVSAIVDIRNLRGR